MDRTLALRCLTAAAVIGVASQALLFRTAIGINVVILTLAVLGTAFVVAWPALWIDRLDVWVPPATAVVVAMFAIRADPTLALLDGLTALVLLGASMAAIGGGNVTGR